MLCFYSVFNGLNFVRLGLVHSILYSVCVCACVCVGVCVILPSIQTEDDLSPVL